MTGNLRPTLSPDEARKIAPEGCQVNWNGKVGKFYVFKVEYTYDPVKKYTKQRRISIGTITNGVFTASRSHLKDLEIQKLKSHQRLLLNNPLKNTAKVLPDKRQASKVVYPLDYVVLVAILSSLSGGTSCVQIADYWANHRETLRQFFPDFPERDISHDSVRNLLMLVEPRHWAELYQLLVNPLIEQVGGRMVAVDGQMVRASSTAGKHGDRYILSFYDTFNGVVLGQKLVGEKTNEIPVAQEMINHLDLEATTVMHTIIKTEAKSQKKRGSIS